jgi:hypothetical protein
VLYRRWRRTTRRWNAAAELCSKGAQVVRVERVVVHEGGQGGDTAAVTKPAPPRATGQERSGITLEDLIGKQPELVGREGV